MIGASIKRCPDCGGTGYVYAISVVSDDYRFQRCIRCDGRGETLMTDKQLDSEFPRTEESNGGDD